MQSNAKSSLLSTLDRNGGSSTRKQLSANTKKFKQRCEAYFEAQIDPVDFDEAKDTQQCSEYAVEIFKHLKVKEVENLPKFGFLEA